MANPIFCKSKHTTAASCCAHGGVVNLYILSASQLFGFLPLTDTLTCTSSEVPQTRDPLRIPGLLLIHGLLAMCGLHISEMGYYLSLSSFTLGKMNFTKTNKYRV